MQNGEPMKTKAEALEGSMETKNVKPSKTQSKQENEIEKTLCLSAGCIHSASNILNQMDSNVEPCDDFYNFACGKFIKNTNIPDEKVSVNTFSLLSDKLQEQLRSLVSEPINEKDAEPFKLAKKMFKACMNKSEFLNEI